MMDQESLSGQTRPEDQVETVSAAAATIIRPPIVTRTKSPDNNHGNRFQSKLLFLFFMRAINNGYKFHLGTELEKFGGKFDDLIFLKDYDKPNPSFLYLQAKHRQDETIKNMITKADLLNTNNDDFSLIKYFHSYRDVVMKAKKGPELNNRVHCVICTNIDFDKDDLLKNGIELAPISILPRELLAFNPIQRQPAINKTGRNLKTKDTNNLKYVANYLHMWAQNPANTPPCLPNKSFQKYFDETLAKNTIVSPFPPVETKSMTFHRDFIEDAPSLSKEAKDLRDFIVKRSTNVMTSEEESWKKWEFQVARKIPTCYRLQPIRSLELHFVANVLRDCANKNLKETLLDKQLDKFKSLALVNEKVIVHRTIKTFRPSFIDTDVKLSSVFAEKFRNIIVKQVPDGSWKNWMFVCLTDGANRATDGECQSLASTNTITEGNSDDYLKELVNYLHELATNTTKLLDEKGDSETEDYYNVLMKECVLMVSGTEMMTMHPDFINGVGLSSGAKALKNIIDKLVNPSGSWTKWMFSYNCIDSFREDQKNIRIEHKHLDDADTSNEIEDFFNNKLIFAINTPNEEEMDSILKEELGRNKKIKLRDTELQSPYILSEINNWFKREKNVWLSAEEGEKILVHEAKKKMTSLRATSLSLDYQEKLNSVLSFNELSVKEMAEDLQKLWLCHSTPEEIEVTHISTPLPTFTAVKVIAALKHQIISESMKPNFERDDSYLVTSSSRLKKGREKEWIRNAFTKKGNPQKLLIVVCDDGDNGIQIFETDDGSDSEDALFSQEEIKSLKGKRVVIIDKDETKGISSIAYQSGSSNRIINRLGDTIAYGQLSPDSINTLLSMTVSFQRKFIEDPTDDPLMKEGNLTVRQLIANNQHENVLDAYSIQELMLKGGKEIRVPSYSATAFEESLYIKRQMRFWGDFDDTFWKELAEHINKNKRKEKQKITVDELQKQSKIDSSTGSIEWSKHIEKELKGKIWEKIIDTRTRNSSQKKISEDELLIEENWERRAVIISGVAGTGKSTLLSHFYEEIKKKDSSVWVIRINLTDHQKALKDFDFDKSGDDLVIFDFLVQLPTVLVGNSPFARSLLRHRLKTCDRIVLMLDGFDEIDRNCQQKTNQLVKSIVADKTRSIGLYVTTRSHMVEDLQLELGQLAYSLDNFSRQDQINCLTSFWKANSDESKSGDEEKDKSDRERIAGKLVDKVTASLKDNERSFIGVPLQCRMVAECFPWRRPVEKQGLATSDRADEKSTFELNIDKQLANFSLVKLYRLLVEKKGKIYLEEKAKVQKAESHCVTSDVDEAKVQLDQYLIHLAIKTIVSDPKDANTLPGHQTTNKFLSEAELEEYELKRGDKGIRYGLLDDRRDDGGDGTTTQQKKKVVFLHRTYAEYFVADYLFKAFHLDDNQHNKLLDNEPVRHFIIKKMFAENDEYNGVRIFFDSMLGELIDEKEWRERVEERNLPERLKQFTKELSSPGVYALRSSVYFRREKTFLFLCDCFDITCDRPQVQVAMQKVLMEFEDVLKFFSEPKMYGDASAKVFQRFLSYFDQEEEIKELIEKLCLTDINYNLIEEKSYWDGEEQIKIVRSLLEFYEKNRLSFNHVFGQKDSRLHILPLLIWNENYHHHGHLQTYLKLLSETDKYSKDDTAFAEAITQSNRFYDENYEKCKVWIDGRIDKTLIALRDLNRLDVVIKLWPHVLAYEPEACRRHYIIHQQQTSNDRPVASTVESFADVADYLKGLLDRDQMQMTKLHRATLFNQKYMIKETLDNVGNIVLSPVDETQGDAYDIGSLAQQVVKLIEVEAMKCCTPLHVAIVCGHEEICDAMLSFLKRVKMIDQNQLKKQLTERNGLLYLTLWINIKLVGEGRKKRVEWILKFIKGRFGQGCLLDLLKLIFTKLKPFERTLTISYSVIEDNVRKSFDNSLDTYFPVIRDIVVSMDPVDAVDNTINEDYYKDLNDLVFHNKKHTRNLVEPNSLRSGERMIDSATLRGMLSAKGVGDWTRQYMERYEIDRFQSGLHFIFSSEFLGILTRDELQQIIEPITEKRKIKGETQTLSYWQFVLSYICDSWYFFDDCFNSISTNKNVDVEWFSQLVWSIDADDFKCCKDDNSIIVGLIRVINVISASVNVSQEFKNEFRRLSKEGAQEMIRTVFFSSSSDDIYSHELVMRLLELFHFYLDYGSDEQLRGFVDFVTANRNWKYGKRQSSFWAKWWPHTEDKEENVIELFRKLSSEKAEICGPDAVKTLLLHDVNGIPFVVRILIMKEDVQSDVFSHLPKETREVVEEYLRENMTKLIDDFFLHPDTCFDEATNRHLNRLNFLRACLNYSITNQRENFIKNITKSGAENNIWVGVLDEFSEYGYSYDASKSMDRFMRCVKEKLGQEAVRQLAMHDYRDEGPYIGYLLRTNIRNDAVKAMIGCLDEELQQQILLKFQEELKKRGENVSTFLFFLKTPFDSE